MDSFYYNHDKTKMTFMGGMIPINYIFPESLEIINFKYIPHQELNKLIFPPSCKSIIFNFGIWDAYPIRDIMFPPYLEHVTFPDYCATTMNIINKIPTMKSIKICRISVSTPLKDIPFPPNLKILNLGKHCNIPFDNTSLDLESLTLGKDYKQPIGFTSYMKNLKYLRLKRIESSIGSLNNLPISLEELRLPCLMFIDNLPHTLKKIIIDSTFSLSIKIFKSLKIPYSCKLYDKDHEEIIFDV
ncbi:MAG: hypothetical protein Gaeavirus7_18 [Gaeavirus sp.]|uniref:FNIP repeat-containing protein n=1 Tax=Gaeavirus sp. TaxID=2487767 RepID=A0A3G5A1J2_9VIRU|nr:MAG: hypothetical protein Gaeavirus7_18 [Gaeavirus sp.]